MIVNEEDKDRLGAFTWGSFWSVTTGHGGGDMGSFFFGSDTTFIGDIKGPSHDAMQELLEATNRLHVSLGNVVFLPAGDIYTFKGVDLNDDGSAAFRLSYRLDVDGKRV